jgi:NADH:ubiquinone oxidoreductase subunit 2 (subunit N)
MYTGFKHLHSTLALVVLAILALALVYHIIGLLTSAEYGKGQRVLALVGLIATHIQLLVGLGIYFISPLGGSNLSGETMKDSLGRLYAVEHPLINIVAIALITIGYSRAKRAVSSKQKFSTITVFYALGLVLILSRIPWQTWAWVN